jgi:hypothetical protein
MIIFIIIIHIILNYNSDFHIYFSGDSAFSYCISLTQILLTSGITQIGPGTGIFAGTGVTSLTIPSTMTAIGEGLLLLLLLLLLYDY